MSSTPRLFTLFLTFLVLISISCKKNKNKPGKSDFSSAWEMDIDRPWAGGDYWLNPLQAWRQKAGALQVEVSGGDRSCVLLTRAIEKSGTNFAMQVLLTPLFASPTQINAQGSQQTITEGIRSGKLDSIGWMGYQIGIQGGFGDYRDDAVHGRGLCLGLTTDGKLFIGDYTNAGQQIKDLPKEVMLIVKGNRNEEAENLQLELVCANAKGREIARLEKVIHPTWIQGLLALTCSQQNPKPVNLEKPRPPFGEVPQLDRTMGGNTFCSFRDWKIAGDFLQSYPERAFGPILWTQYTLSENLLKMSVQFAPLGNENDKVTLLVDGMEKQESQIVPDAYNALFRIPEWESSSYHTYTVLYQDKSGKEYRYEGTIRKEPNKKNDLVVAALSCADDVGFPHQDLANNVNTHQADLFTFHGDQIYERVAGYGVERSSVLDYLRKWYIFGWSFREFMRNAPTVIIPDDHDVFHGNLWGEGGKRADTSKGWGYDAQDSGGYKEPPSFVNMVHRTQTAHLPAPFDPSPVKNDISVYYTHMNYGGVSFAILGDRQWKSAPKPLLPDAEIENGWPQNKAWNAKTDAFHEDAELLGDRQESFLEEWVKDWPQGVYFKALISQSPFCNIATLPAHIYHDKYVPGLPKYKKGEYPVDDRPVADFDANAWPQNKRDHAIRIIRKGFALHITGDQHLGSTGQYGVQDFGDSGYWISTPAISNLWPRRWYPAERASSGRKEGDPRYVGNYEDGFGNKMTVKAVANPYDLDREPGKIFDKAPGYSIITFRKKERTINLAVWPRWSGAGATDTPFTGWPIKINQQDNYGRKAAGTLAGVEVDGEELVQVFDESKDALLYSLRPKAGTFTPKVFDGNTTYNLKKFKNGIVVMNEEGLRVKE